MNRPTLPGGFRPLQSFIPLIPDAEFCARPSPCQCAAYVRHRGIGQQNIRLQMLQVLDKFEVSPPALPAISRERQGNDFPWNAGLLAQFRASSGGVESPYLNMTSKRFLEIPSELQPLPFGTAKFKAAKNDKYFFALDVQCISFVVSLFYQAYLPAHRHGLCLQASYDGHQSSYLWQ